MIRVAGAAGLVFVVVAAIAGVARLSFDDDYRRVFQSRSPEFAEVEQVFRDFGTDEADVIIVLEADDVTTPERLAGLDRLEAALFESPLVAQVISILSIPEQGGGTRPVFLPGVPESDALDAARSAAARHPLIAGRLLSEDRGTTVVVVQLAAPLLDPAALAAGLRAVEEAVAPAEPVFKRVRFTGVPALRAAVRENALRSQLKYVALGGSLAIGIAWLLFRSFAVIVAVAAGPIVAVLWALGALGWAGQDLNLLNHLIIELIFVISFTDAVHIAFHVRDRRAAGDTPGRAALSAIRNLWVACGLTSVTTAIGFGSLVFVSLDVVRGFGLSCAAGTLIGFVAVITVVPLASTFVSGGFANARPVSLGRHGADLAAWLCRHARPTVAVGVLLLVTTTWLALGLESDYRYRDFAPMDHDAVQALTHVDRSIGGTLPLRVVIEWPENRSLADPEVQAVIGKAQSLLAANALTSGTLSVLDLLDASDDSEDAIARRLRLVPAGIVARLIRPDLRRALISAQWPDIGGRVQLPQIEQIDAQLSALVAEEPGFNATVTGIVALSAQASAQTIRDLVRSLAIATLLIFPLMLVAFRSFRLALVSLFANVIPLAGAAGMLRVIGAPLEYSTVLAFLICIGLAVDDTIHFLVYFRQRIASGDSLEGAIRSTVTTIGRVLITTTAILLAGFGVLMTGAVPAEIRMGFLSCVALLLALAADLAILPASLSIAYRGARHHDP